MTLVTATTSHSAQLRAANYYLQKLDQMNRAYQSGGENVLYALQTFDQEWGQIRRWYLWLVENSHRGADISALCAKYLVVGKDILFIRLHLDERVAWFEHSLETSLRAGYPDLIVQNLLALSEMYIPRGESQNAIDYARRVFDYFPEQSHDLTLGKAYSLIAGAEMGRGDIKAARDYYEKALEIFQTHHEVLSIAETQYQLSTIAGRSGDYGAVIQYVEAALLIFERFGNLFYLGGCYNHLGLVASEQDRMEEAIAYFRKSIIQYEHLHFPTGHARALANLATALAKVLQYDDAEIVANQSLQLAQEVGDKKAIADALIRLGRIYIPQEKYSQADDYLLEALAIVETLDSPYARCSCLQLLGRNALYQNQFERAEALFRRGLPIAEAINDTVTITLFLTGVCEALRKQTRFQEAKQFLYASLTPAALCATETQADVIQTAIELWCDLQNYQSAVRWYGLLNAYPVSPLIREQLDTIYNRFASKVELNDLEAWLNEGSTLSLEGVLAELTERLAFDLSRPTE